MTMSGELTRRPVATAVAVGAAAVAGGYALSAIAGVSINRQYLPWILGRGLGIAGYLTLTLLTLTGLWLRHPFRLRSTARSARSWLWVHATLASTTAVLIAGHIAALAMDRFAGVGWVGAFVPGAATYRPVAVALGTGGLYLGMLAAAAIALAGRLLGRSWVGVHRIAAVSFVLVWLHAMFAGSDTATLRPLYVASGAAVAALAVSRPFLTEARPMEAPA